jgi:hypothetical protein
MIMRYIRIFTLPGVDVETLGHLRKLFNYRDYCSLSEERKEGQRLGELSKEGKTDKIKTNFEYNKVRNEK